MMPPITVAKGLYRKRKSMQGAGAPFPLGSGTRSAGAAAPRGAGVRHSVLVSQFGASRYWSTFHRHANHEPADNDGKWCQISADRVRGGQA